MSFLYIIDFRYAHMPLSIAAIYLTQKGLQVTVKYILYIVFSRLLVSTTAVILLHCLSS